VFRLRNSIQPYAWGSRTALAALQGRAPSATPEAELWMGAHPLAPSRLSDTGRSLEEAIAEAPAALLGAPLVARLGRELPYLVKLLAAQQPLSLQAHPDAQQAAEGFAAEEAAGVPRTAPHRNYKDRNPKPELVVALTPFEALCGFKPIEALLALERALDVPGFSAALAPLRASPDAHGLVASFAALLHTPAGEREALVHAVLAALPLRPGLSAEAAQSQALQAQYPGDLGIVSALLLQRVTLQPGEGLSLGAGNLHAYLSGLAVEVMANSDNVLRGGLTPKHVDVAQLLKVLDFAPRPLPLVRPLAQADGEELWATPAPHFRLSRRTLAAGEPWSPARRGPELLLCTHGQASLEAGAQRLTLSPGESAFCPASDPPWSARGAATLWRVTPGD
jgi:mannose-6-phosphate isomerase